MKWIGRLGAAWGALGVSALLLSAIWRLSPKAIAAYELGLTPLQWFSTALFVIFMGYSEGYRGFQQRFSPRTAARVRYLRDRPDPIRSLLAPLFTMGFFHANRRTKIVAYGLSFGILTLVLLTQTIAQPWRGIIDAGVVFGLTWGLISLSASIATALTRADYAPSPEVE